MTSLHLLSRTVSSYVIRRTPNNITNEYNRVSTDFVGPLIIIMYYYVLCIIIIIIIIIIM